ncbi:MAG TPA: GAF domain-containing sensor histidine kinase [Pyrinomonadaceae bacterium]|nr:GAF domain-containing sensor histidine kinase [Pyrinomonadaceae bacterium]
MEETFADDLEAVARIDAIPRILEVVCRTTGMGFSAVARVTEDRWIACAVRDEIDFGLKPGGELQIKTTICDEIRDTRQPVVIDHVAEDMNFCKHPTPKLYGFQSYISVPILRPDGRFFGTLCAIDPKPALLSTPEAVGMFKLFAELIAFHLDAQERLRLSESALFDERETAQLREQFIAVLGHDLRNPLNAVRVGAELLRMTALDERAEPVVGLIEKSAARMTGLVENILDFARGRLGEGLKLNLADDEGLRTALEQVIEEVRVAWPGREVRSQFSLSRPVRCDAARVAQMFSNLLANAITHGDPAGPVWVSARCADGGGFELSVANLGDPIPPETAQRLFQPFTRARAQPGREGLGLGLYIASEIAHAHGGTLEVESSKDETRFTFRMPARAA